MTQANNPDVPTADLSKVKPNLTHIAGTFLIQASGSFLNGAGLGRGEDRNYTIIKYFQDGKNTVPYVSSQAWRRWLRDTLIEETKWEPSRLRALHYTKESHTDKIGGEFNPIEFPEDDIFGYMRTEKGSGQIRENDDETDLVGGNDTGQEDQERKSKGTRVKSLARTSPFSSSILVSLRSSGWQGVD
jgi:CRISPR-associated protein Cst2